MADLSPKVPPGNSIVARFSIGPHSMIVQRTRFEVRSAYFTPRSDRRMSLLLRPAGRGRPPHPLRPMIGNRSGRSPPSRARVDPAPLCSASVEAPGRMTSFGYVGADRRDPSSDCRLESPASRRRRGDKWRSWQREPSPRSTTTSPSESGRCLGFGLLISSSQGDESVEGRTRADLSCPLENLVDWPSMPDRS